jgi:hypothetical protein
MSQNHFPPIRQETLYRGLATMRVLTVVTTLNCLLSVSCGSKSGSSSTPDPDTVYTESLPTHSLEQRKIDLLDLLAEAENDHTLNKKQVESRMGRPDSVWSTGSKEFEDRAILTHYEYQLAASEYSLPKSQKISLPTEGRACFTFDDRTPTYGSKGRPWSVRDDTAPLVLVQLEVADDERYPHIFRSIWSWSRRD